MLDSDTNDMLWELYNVCSRFIADNRVSCAEETVEDRVYENAPGLVEEIAKIIGYCSKEK